MNPESQLQFLTKRNILLAVGVMALMVGWPLRAPVVVGIGEFVLALLAVCWWTSRKLLDSVEVKRIHLPHAFEKQTLEVELRCRHRSRFAIDMLELTDEFPPGDNFMVRTNLSEPFQRGAELRLHYNGLCSRHRGLYLLGPARLSAADPLGLFERRRAVEEVTPLYLLPNSRGIESMDLLSQGVLAHIGDQVLARPGHGESFLHLREYRHGDSPRHIHWPTSVRCNQLMVKEFEDNVTTDVNLFLDMRRLAQRGVGDASSTELIVRAAACMAQTAIAQSHRVQIFAVGQGVEHIPAGEGEAHLFHILDRMAVWRPAGQDDLGQAARERLCYVRPGSTLVWIVSTSVFDPAWLEPLVPPLLADGVKVVTIFIDDRTFHKVYGEQTEFHYRGERLEDLVARFRALGCAVYTAGREDDLAAQLAMPATPPSGKTPSSETEECDR